MEDTGGVIVIWVIFCLVIGAIGSGRTIGFWGAFLFSLILSPLIGLIIVLTYKSKTEQSTGVLSKPPEYKQPDKQKDIADIHVKLENLESMKVKNLITEIEYQEMRKEIMKT